MAGPRRPAARDGGVHAVKAVAVIAVLVLIGIAVLSRSNATSTLKAGPGTTSARAHTTTTPPTSVAVTTTTSTTLPAAAVKVQVVNGLLTGNLASLWTAKVKTKTGFTTELPDDATTKTTASAIYIMTPGYLPEAQILASAVGLPTSAINQTIPAPASAPVKSSERTAANLILVVGQELSGG